MEHKIRQIINEIMPDLEQACAEMGEGLDAGSLADAVGDRMFDDCEEYRNMPYPERRAIVLEVCKEYV